MYAVYKLYQNMSLNKAIYIALKRHEHKQTAHV